MPEYVDIMGSILGQRKDSQGPAADPGAGSCITREVDPSTGVARTVVREADGVEHVFGGQTVKSLIESEEEKSSAFVAGLMLPQLHGLVHEVGQRLVQASQLCQIRMKEREAIQEVYDYASLGLSPDASEKELDAAYRKLAKRMHPDKNGGTEEAKAKFQRMKECYEELKRRKNGEDGKDPKKKKKKKGDKKRKKKDKDEGKDEVSKDEDVDNDDNEDSAEPPACLEDGEPPENSWAPDPNRKKEAYDESDEDSGSSSEEDEEKGRISYDPNNHESMTATVRKMLKDLKVLNKQVAMLEQEIKVLRKNNWR